MSAAVERRLVRASSGRVLEGPGVMWVLGAGEHGVRLDGDAARLAAAVLDVASSPVTRAEIVDQVLARAGGDASGRGVIGEALDLLTSLGALVEPAAARPTLASTPVGRVLVCLTGAVASMEAPRRISALLAAGHDVRVTMTRAARRFATPRALEALTHRSVTTSLWTGRADAPAPHIELARWADVVLVDPCSATTLSRLVAGDCGSLVPALVTATRAPVLLVPSMNPDMLRSGAVRRNLEAAVERGFYVASTGAAYEVADAPGQRAILGGGGAPIAMVLRMLPLLLERAALDAPALATREEWELEHASQRAEPEADAEMLAALEGVTGGREPRRVLEVGTGRGALARAMAARGHEIVATDFSARAIERAAQAPATAGHAVTWLVDDVTRSCVHATFEVCVDRGCFGCVPVAQRARYVEQVARWLTPGGAWVLEAYGPSPAQLRAHGLDRSELAELTRGHFDLESQSPSSLSFGVAGPRPASIYVLRRRAP